MTWLDTTVVSPLKRFKPGVIAAAVIGVALFATLAFWVMRTTALPESVDTLTIENPTEFSVDVAVSDSAARTWLPLGVVPAGGERAFTGVFDQGDEWVFRFRSQGVDSAPHSVDRSELAASAWTVVVPDSVPDELRAGGAEPAP